MGLISRVSSRTYRLTLSSYKKDKKKMADQDWAQEEVVEDVVQDGENFNEGDEFEGEEPLVEDVPVLLFGKWDPSEVNCNDMALADYINFKGNQARYLPHSSGRFNKIRFRKAQCPIVERLIGAMMIKSRNAGKKMLAMRIVKHTFEIIHLMTGENPIQILVTAVMNGGPREDSTRIGRAGSVRRQSCDVSPLRRTNQAIWFMTHGAKNAAFRNVKTIAECLADELMNTAKGSSNSFAIKKKDELERVAKSNR